MKIDENLVNKAKKALIGTFRLKPFRAISPTVIRISMDLNWFIFIALVIFLCDRLSVIAFKDVFRRYRRCHNLAISHLTYTLNGYCGGLYGFVSSHAANRFGLALFFGNVLKKEYKWFFIFILFWSSIVAYNRVYLGVHYSGDVIAGALLGIFFGWVVFKLFDHFLLNS
jgi:undecaprenyl-diphosphatase